MELQTIGQAAIGAGVLVGAVFTGWQSWQANRNAKHARGEAATAAVNAHPLSNGWGTQVTNDLAYLRNGMELLHTRQEMTERRAAAEAERNNAVAAIVTEHVADREAHTA